MRRAFTGFLGVAMPCVIVVVAACSQGAGGTSDGGSVACPQDLPSACPADVPSYGATVEPLIERRCFPCHAKGGVGTGGGNEFTSYASVFEHRSGILNQVYSCTMPQAGAAPLTSDERAALLGWLVCHAPNN